MKMLKTEGKGGGLQHLPRDLLNVIAMKNSLIAIVAKMQRNKVNPVLSGHSKIDKTKVLKRNGSLMDVESIAECSPGAFCNTFDLH